MKKLWICSHGQVRSVTAAAMYGGKFGGLDNRYQNLEELVEWADHIFVFEDYDVTTKLYNTERLIKEYPLSEDKIMHVIKLRDIYGEAHHPVLCERIENAMYDWFLEYNTPPRRDI